MTPIFGIVLSVGALVGLGMELRVLWRRRADGRAQRVLDEAMGLSSSPEQFPAVYVGPDTPWGLRSGTVCRVVRRKAGNVVAICDVSGQAWNVPRDRVASRRGGAVRAA